MMVAVIISGLEKVACIDSLLAIVFNSNKRGFNEESSVEPDHMLRAGSFAKNCSGPTGFSLIGSSSMT